MDPTIIGGALGAIARFAPEVLNFYDRKDRRKHELAVLQTQQAATDRVEAVRALVEGIKAQATMTGVKWVDALSQLIRPVITLQWVIVMYPAALILQWVAVFQQHGGDMGAAVAATARVFGPEERAMCAGIVNFWFLDRVIKKAGAA